MALKLKASPNAHDSRYIEAYTREAAVQRRFAGLPGILEVIDFGQVRGDLAWIAMEFAPLSIADFLGSDPIPPAAVTNMLRQVLVGLDRLHAFEQVPVLHRDVKPSNILVSGANHSPRFLLSDIEVSPEGAPPMPCTATRARYMAPEYCGGDARHESPASDIYSLGMVAYHMLLGNDRFESLLTSDHGNASQQDHTDVAAWMQWHCSPSLVAPMAHDLVPGVPRVLSETVARMIAKPLDQRYSSALDAVRDLTRTRAAITPRTEQGLDVAVPQRKQYPWHRRWDLRMVGLVMIGGAVTMGAWSWSRPEPVVTIDMTSAHVGYGKERLIRVHGDHLPEGSRVMLQLPNDSPREMKVVDHTAGAVFECRIQLPKAKSITGQVFVEGRRGERVASSPPIAIQRLDPLEVVVTTKPLAPGAHLLVRGASGFESDLLMDDRGRATLRLDPGDYDISSSGRDYEVTGGSVKRTIVEDEDTQWSIALTPLTGTVVLSIDPPTATVVATSQGDPKRVMTLSVGPTPNTLDAGGWQFVAEAEGFKSRTETVLVPKGEKLTLVWKLQETPPPAPPPPPPAAEPEPIPVPAPVPLSEVARTAQELIPLQQLKFTMVPVSDRIRISGPVFSDEELQLLKRRLEPIADRVELEVRVDEEVTLERLVKALKDEGFRFQMCRTRGPGVRPELKISHKQSVPEAPARVAEIVSHHLLVPESLKISWNSL